MTNVHHNQLTCGVCGRSVPAAETRPVELVSESVLALLRNRNPTWDGTGQVCLPDLNRARGEYVQHVLEEERGELSELERSVIAALSEQDLLSTAPPDDDAPSLALRDRLSDRIASFGGSWSFLILFGLAIAVWVTVNTAALLARPFDPYPYILLNLFLSCLAAVQAPVILMSQNRQARKDRERALHDYKVNLKAELEIRLLSEKVDRLLHHQWRRLLEIQKIQTDFMEELAARERHGKGREAG